MKQTYFYFESLIKEKSLKHIKMAILICFSFSTYGQTTVYVNSISGDDVTGDGTSGNPYQSFHKGYTIAISGDTINLTGTFTWTDAIESGDVAGNGYIISKNLTIQGQGSGNTIVQAASTPSTSDRRVFEISNSRIVKFKNLTIRYGRGYGGWVSTTYFRYYGGAIGSGYGTSNNVDLSLEHVEISDNYSITSAVAGVYCEGAFSASNCTFQNNTRTSGEAIALQLEVGNPGVIGTRNIINSTFYNNTSTNSTAYAVRFDRKGGNVINSTFIGNTNSIYAYALQENSDELYIVNCILADSGDYDIYHYARFANYLNGIKCINSIVEEARSDFDTVNYTNSLVGEQVNLNISTPTTNNGNNLMTPYLVLASNSVAINAGTTGSFGSIYSGGSIAIPSKDQLGATRSGNVDMGSFEYGGVLSVEDKVSTMVKIFPTVTSGLINISDDNTYQFCMYNMLGQEIESGKVRRKMDISKHAKGLYLIKLRAENLERTFKVVLE